MELNRSKTQIKDWFIGSNCEPQPITVDSDIDDDCLKFEVKLMNVRAVLRNACLARGRP